MDGKSTLLSTSGEAGLGIRLLNKQRLRTSGKVRVDRSVARRKYDLPDQEANHRNHGEKIFWSKKGAGKKEEQKKIKLSTPKVYQISVKTGAPNKGLLVG